jgi:hypothetical protein
MSDFDFQEPVGLGVESFPNDDISHANFSFIAQSLDESMIPMGDSTVGVSKESKKEEVLRFGDGFVPIPVDAVLRPACGVSQALSFGDLYSSLVCIDHRDNTTSVYVSTGTAFFSSVGHYIDGVADFRIYIQVSSLLRILSLAGSHVGVSGVGVSLGFWGLVVPVQPVTDSDDLRKHFSQAEERRDLKYVDIDFPFSALPSKILGLYSASLVTLQPTGVVWYSSENKHFLGASFPFKVALHITTVQVLRSHNFKRVFLEKDRMFLQTDSFSLCVPTFSIDDALFQTSFGVPDLPAFTGVVAVQMSTLLRSSDLFSGRVRFRVFNDGKKSFMAALSDDRDLFKVPLVLADSGVLFDFIVGSDSLFDISAINGVGQDFISSTSGVCIFFKS